MFKIQFPYIMLQSSLFSILFVLVKTLGIICQHNNGIYSMFRIYKPTL